MTAVAAPLRITADDYGLTPAINAGIEELARRGAITAVSIAVHRGSVLDSVNKLVDSRVAIGLHVVLVEEAPLLGGELEALLDDRGRLPSNWAALFAAVSSRPRLLGACLREARAQLDRLLGLGVPCDFVNSHQHVHLYPPLWAALAPLWERATDRAVRARVPWCGGAKQRALALSSRAACALCPTESPVLRPIGLDVAGRMDGPALERTLRGARRFGRSEARHGIVEIVTHPGFADPTGSGRYSHWNYRWQLEHDTLASDELDAVLGKYGFAKEPR